MGKITRDSFIRINDVYLLVGSNSCYVSEKEMNKIIEDNSYLDALLDLTSNECQGKKKRAVKNETIKSDTVEETTTIKE